MLANFVTYEILYNSKNITADIQPFVLGLTYIDHASTDADELTIVLNDSEKLWQDAWYPTKGDKLSVKILNTQGTLNCGVFTIDETTGSFTSDGDTITIKALAAGIDREIRTKKFYAHENKSLREIANTIASDNKLKLVGNIANIKIQRKTQYDKTDLHFLQELANTYGYTFSIRDDIMTFTNMFEIEGREESLTIERNEIKSANFSDKTSETYGSVDVQYHNPRQKSLISYSKNETEPAFAGRKPDTMVIRRRVENQQQAEIMGKVALYKANSLKQEGTIEMEGNIYLVAGVCIQLFGFGMFSGKYFINQSSHSPSKESGYITSIEVKRVGMINKTDGE